MIQFLIFGSPSKTKTLLKTLNECILEKKLDTVVCAKICNNTDLKKTIGITQDPTIVLEESALDYRDILLEGIIPNKEDSLLLLEDIFGTGKETGGCSSGGCTGCLGGCH